MKICGKHWSMMRNAVEERGMTKFILSAEENVQAMIEVANTASEWSHGFDPLMSMNWSVVNQALALFGLRMMTTKEDGSEYCPVCEAMNNPCQCGGSECNVATAEAVEKEWINGPADIAFEECVRRGMITVN